MNFKPFYVDIGNLDRHRALELHQICIINGAESAYDLADEYDIGYYYLGVNEEGVTIGLNHAGSFGSEAVQLTYEEALLHIQGKDDKYRILEGESEDFFPVSSTDTKELDKILMMDTISLRLPESMIKDLIEATEGKISYKTLIRKLIKEYLDKGDK